MKRILAYILLLIMAVQILPQSLFEQEMKAVVVLEKEMKGEDNLKEKSGKEAKIAALHNHDFTNIAIDLTPALRQHSPLILSPEKDVATPPPDIC